MARREPMIKGAIVRHCALIAACACVMAAACGGSSASSGGDAGTVPPPPGNDSGAGNDDANTPVNPDDAGTPTPTKKDGGGLKSIGSPCTLDTECTSGSCNSAIPNGMCTKACMADTDCTEKGNKTGAACVNSLCFEFCKDLDAGVATDGGKAAAPCKNKALQCEVVSGETTLVCMYDSDASTTDDGGTDQDATPDATTDASGD
jgi:hypothetical protein